MRLLRRKSRKLEGCGKLELDRVIGLTTASANGLSCNVVTGDLAYLAGNVVVIYNVKANCQTRFLMAQKNSKPFSCVAYSSQGGKFLGAGESGHQPGVIVWEVSTGSCIADMRTHKYGVCSVQFSPNGKHLVSIGVPHDGYVCVWDWKSGTLLAKPRASTASLPACAMQFASDGSFLVTGGAKHLKHWIIGVHKARSAGGNGTVGMEGKSVKLGSQKDSSFVSILCAPPPKESTVVTPDFEPLYALTAGGVLCLLHCGLAIEKWVDLKVRHGFALAVSEAHVGCACSDGIVRIFMHGSLTYAVTLPRPAPYGYHGLTDANIGATLAVGDRIQPGIRFPDAVACCFLHEGQKLAVIYGDHSLFVWDVRSFSKIGSYRTFLSHSSCIWDVSILPTTQQAPAPELISEKDCLPGGAFATCSADGTIRMWYLGSGQEGTSLVSNAGSSPTPRPANIYSKDILAVLYIDKSGERPTNGSTDEELVDTSHGFRSICASPDGQQLAAGDRNGNLRIYDLNTLKLISFQEAHDAEILSLSFTSNTNDRLVEEPVCVPLLASGGRDRLIHIYDVNRDYDVVETLDDHSASITTVKFACCGSKLLSCSADKSVVFRNVVASSSGCKSTRYHQEIAPRGTIYDLDTDPSDKLAVTVGQDKKLNILNLSSGKPVRYIKPEGDVGEPIKVRMDPSGMYVVCSHSDKYMRVYDFSSGELLAQASGHAEVITGVTFLPDCRRIISVSGDSCIFIWRLPLSLSRSMRKRCRAKAESRPPSNGLKPLLPQSPKDLAGTTPKCVHQVTPFNPLDVNVTDVRPSNEGSDQRIQGEDANNVVAPESNKKEAEVPQTEPGASRKLEAETPAGFKFSISRLPPWAQAKVAVEDTSSSDGKPESKGDGNSLFESRWAERLGRDGYRLFSESRKETASPASRHAAGGSIRRCFSMEAGASIIMDSTPESICSQPEGSPSASPQEPLRRDPQWKTMHTVFFDEHEYPHDFSPAKAGLLNLATGEGDSKNRTGSTGACSNAMPHTMEETERLTQGEKKRNQGTCEAEEEDGVVTDLSDDDQDLMSHRCAVSVTKTKPFDDKEDDTVVYYETPGIAVTCNLNKDGDGFDVSSKRRQSSGGLESFNLHTMDHPQTAPCSPFNKTVKQALDADGDCKRMSSLESPKVLTDCESTKEDDEEGADDDSSPHRDLFSAHFDKLASDLKVEGSARSSFSTRFFARSNPSLFQMSLFGSGTSPRAGQMSRSETQALLQDDDLENNPGRLLAAERERLKLRERQDKMAVEVQRMRERLVNLGIAVAEIAHEGENTDGRKIGDGEDKTPGSSHYSLAPRIPEQLNHAAAEREAACVSKPPSEPPAPAYHGVRKAPSSSLPVRVEDGPESLWVERISTSAMKRMCCNGLKVCGLYGSDSIAPSKLGTPRTPPADTFSLKNMDGRKTDLMPTNTKEEPEGERKQTLGEKVVIRLPTGPHVRLEHMQGMADRKEKGNEEKVLGCQVEPVAPANTIYPANQADRGENSIEEQGLRSIKPPAKAVGSGLANRGDKSAEERGVTYRGDNPCTRASVSRPGMSELVITERTDHQTDGDHIDSLSSRVSGRGMDRGDSLIEDLEGETENENQGPSGGTSTTEKKVDMSSGSAPSSCTSSACRDAKSPIKSSGRPNVERGEKSIEDLRIEFQADDRTSRTPGRRKNVDINEFLGLSEIMVVEARDRLLCSSESLGGNSFTSTPPLPRPIEDYQKSLQDLMEAADRASSLFGEVRSICQRTSTPEAPATPSTPSSNLPPGILSLSRAYQTLLPGTLQTVQRLADEAAACGLPSAFNKDVKFTEGNSLDDNNFGKSHDYGFDMLQSRPGTGTSSTDSLLASFDVEGLISRYSETLATQVLALVQKALPDKQA